MSLLDNLGVAEPQFVIGESFYFDMAIVWLLRCVGVIIYHS